MKMTKQNIASRLFRIGRLVMVSAIGLDHRK
jgi:hypothetical protein